MTPFTSHSISTWHSVSSSRVDQVPGQSSSGRRPANKTGDQKMRRSFPIALALAAFTVVGVCGTASAVMNNPNPSTPAPKAVIKTKPKPTAAQTTSTSPAVTKSNATAAAPTTQSTAPNSSTTPASSKPGDRSGRPPAVQLRQDITKEEQLINKNKDYIAEIQKWKVDFVPERMGKWSPGVLGCHSGVCYKIYNAYIPGRDPVPISIQVDVTGRPLPGEFDRLVNARKAALDKAIAADTQRITAAKKRVADDYSALGRGNDGED